MAEAGASDATLMAVSGHMSRRMAGALQLCAHGGETHGVGQTGKRFDGQACRASATRNSWEGKLNGYVAIHVTKTPSEPSLRLYSLDLNGGRSRARTADLLLVRQAL